MSILDASSKQVLCRIEWSTLTVCMEKEFWCAATSQQKRAKAGVFPGGPRQRRPSTTTALSTEQRWGVVTEIFRDQYLPSQMDLKDAAAIARN